MRPRHLPPYHSYLRAPDLSLAAVDICDALAEIEARGLGILYAFNLDEGGIGVGVPLACCQWLVVSRDFEESGLRVTTNRVGMRGACPCNGEYVSIVFLTALLPRMTLSMNLGLRAFCDGWWTVTYLTYNR